MPDTAVKSARQRPEDILAATLSGGRHPEATDGWSPRGRRIFFVALTVAGILLVVAGLLVTKQLGPRPGNPAPLETGPGNGLADQLLKSGEQPPDSPPASAPLALPLPPTPTTQAGKTSTLAPPPVMPTSAASTPTANPLQQTPPTTAPPSPTSTIPCAGLIGQTVQQLPLPCRTGARSTTIPLG